MLSTRASLECLTAGFTKGSITTRQDPSRVPQVEQPESPRPARTSRQRGRHPKGRNLPYQSPTPDPSVHDRLGRACHIHTRAAPLSRGTRSDSKERIGQQIVTNCAALTGKLPLTKGCSGMARSGEQSGPFLAAPSTRLVGSIAVPRPRQGDVGPQAAKGGPLRETPPLTPAHSLWPVRQDFEDLDWWRSATLGRTERDPDGQAS